MFFFIIVLPWYSADKNNTREDVRYPVPFSLFIVYASCSSILVNSQTRDKIIKPGPNIGLSH